MGSECANDDFHMDYKRLAIEVTTRNSTDIQETLADTVTAMFTKLQADVANHGQRLEEVESRMLFCESATAEMQTNIQAMSKDNRRLSEKVDDLENRSRRNNLSITGLPETILQTDLLTLCERELPEALGLQATCKVERAHRLGPDLRGSRRDRNPNVARPSDRPQQIIVKYLDYTDKVNILRSFKSLKTEVKLRGHKIVIFGDFSLEVTQKRRAFSNICSTLFRRQTRFALLYPAILKVFLKEGPPVIYRSPGEAMKALNISASTPPTSPPKGVAKPTQTSKRPKGETDEEPLCTSQGNESPPKDQRKRQAHKIGK